jgi:hypothetical protein
MPDLCADCNFIHQRRPGLPKGQAHILEGKVDYIIVDRMNYHHADWIYAKQGWGEKKTDDYFRTAGSMIAAECEKRGIDCRLAY